MSTIAKHLKSITDLIDALVNTDSTSLPVTLNSGSIISHSAAAGGAATVVLDIAAIGPPTPGFGDVFSLTCAGLDGGSYAVNLVAPGADTTLREHVAAASETDTVVIDGPIVAEIDVIFSSLGTAAVPVVYLSSRSR
jgi:hypothetical protein